MTTKVSSSNGLEKRPKLRFPEFEGEWESKSFSSLYTYVNEKNDGSFSVDSIISVANMYFKPDARITDMEYLKTYNIFKLGDIAFEGNKSKDFSFGRFVENTIGDGIVSHVFVVFRPVNNFHNFDYWKYAINNENVMGRILARCTKKTTMMTNLVTADFLAQKIYCPSLEEQAHIASFLSLIDKRIRKQKELLEVLKKYKRGLLQDAFPKKGETVPKLRMAGFTGAWEQCKVEDLVDVCSGRDYKHLSKGDIPVYGTGGYMLSVSEALSYDRDAIGIGRKGTIDKPYILHAPFWTVDTLFYALPREKIDLNFVFSIFQNIVWKKQDESTGVPSLSKTVINKIAILIPQYNEQQTIGAFFKKIDHLISLHEIRLILLRQQKTVSCSSSLYKELLQQGGFNCV